jgi:hypothetical protein
MEWMGKNWWCVRVSKSDGDFDPGESSGLACGGEGDGDGVRSIGVLSDRHAG